MIDLSPNFKQDTLGANLNVIPMVVIGDDIYISEVKQTFDSKYWEDLNLKINSIKESVDFENRKFKISNVTLTLNNYIVNGERFSDGNYMNKEVKIYWKSQSCTLLDDCLFVYQGIVRRFDHTAETVTLQLEDLTEKKLHKDLPLRKIPDEITTYDKYKNQPIPMLFGYLEKAPIVINDNIELLADDVDCKIYELKIFENDAYLKVPHITSSVYEDNYYNNRQQYDIITEGFDKIQFLTILNNEDFVGIPESSITPAMDNILIAIQPQGIDSFSQVTEDDPTGELSNDWVDFRYLDSPTLNDFTPQTPMGNVFQINGLLHRDDHDEHTYKYWGFFIKLKEIGSFSTFHTEVKAQWFCRNVTKTITDGDWNSTLQRSFPRVRVRGNTYISAIDSDEGSDFIERKLELFGGSVLGNLGWAESTSYPGLLLYTRPGTVINYNVMGFETDNGWGKMVTDVEDFRPDYVTIKHHHERKNAIYGDFAIEAAGREGSLYSSDNIELPNGEVMSLIVKPSDIIHHITKEELNYNATIDQDIIDIARDEHADWRMDFSVNKKINSKKLFEEISSSSKLMPRFAVGGKLDFATVKDSYTYEEAIEVKSSDIIKYSFSRTKIEDVKTKVKVLYGYDYGLDNYLKSIEERIDEWKFPNYDFSFLGEINEVNEEDTILEFESKYIQDDVTAEKLRDFLLYWHCNQHTKFKLTLPLSYLYLEVGDVVRFDSLLDDLKAYGEDYTQVVPRNGQHIYPAFMVTSLNKNPDKIDVEAIQLHYLGNDGVHGWQEPNADPYEVYGCMDDTAVNYNPNATIDNNSCVFPMGGDPTGDNIVNVLDIIPVVNHIIDVAPLTGWQLYAADLNNDGIVNVIDIVAIVDTIIGEDEDGDNNIPQLEIEGWDNVVAGSFDMEHSFDISLSNANVRITTDSGGEVTGGFPNENDFMALSETQTATITLNVWHHSNDVERTVFFDFYLLDENGENPIYFESHSVKQLGES